MADRRDKAILGALKSARRDDRVFYLRRRPDDDRELLWLFVFPREVRLYSLARGQGIYDAVRALTAHATVVDGPWLGYDKPTAAKVAADFADYIRVQRGLRL